MKFQIIIIILRLIIVNNFGDFKMVMTQETVTFSRETLNELYSNDYYREVLEAIEDRELLREAKLNADEIIPFSQYDRNRRQKSDV